MLLDAILETLSTVQGRTKPSEQDKKEAEAMAKRWNEQRRAMGLPEWE